MYADLIDSPVALQESYSNPYSSDYEVNQAKLRGVQSFLVNQAKVTANQMLTDLNSKRASRNEEASQINWGYQAAAGLVVATIVFLIIKKA